MSYRRGQVVRFTAERVVDDAGIDFAHPILSFFSSKIRTYEKGDRARIHEVTDTKVGFRCLCGKTHYVNPGMIELAPSPPAKSILLSLAVSYSFILVGCFGISNIVGDGIVHKALALLTVFLCACIPISLAWALALQIGNDMKTMFTNSER